MNLPNTIFIVGPSGGGKSLFARLLSNALHVHANPIAQGWNVADCSTFLAKRLAHVLHPHLTLPGFTEQQLSQHIIDHKDRFRESLRRIGEQLAKDAPAALIREAKHVGRIVVGVRRREEVIGYAEYMRDWRRAGNHNDLWILVDSTALSVQDDFDRAFFQMQVCKKKIWNNGNMDLLRQNAQSLADEILQESGK